MTYVEMKGRGWTEVWETKKHQPTLTAPAWEVLMVQYIRPILNTKHSTSSLKTFRSPFL